MELRDIYTRDGKFTGIVREKHDPKVAGEYYLHAVVILRNLEGQYVLAQRHLKARYFPGKWDVTGGGVAHGETPMEAGVREVREELGLTIDPEYMKPIHQYLLEYENGDGAIVHVFGAVCDTSAGYHFDPAEVNAVKAVPFIEFLETVMYNKDEAFAETLKRYDQEANTIYL